MRPHWLSALPLFGATLFVACGSGSDAPSAATAAGEAGSGAASASTATSESASGPSDQDELERWLSSTGINRESWSTDFGRRSVPLDEITSGGPPKDGIPAIDAPKFVSVEAADEWLDDREPVQVLELDGEVRAYPLQILIWHEIVNDRVGDRPVAVTYCPLCNSAIAFESTLPDGTELDFGTTGRLRFSDLVMYDRQTESWWQQITGEAIIGELLGTSLKFLPSSLIAWADFKEANPGGMVLSRETGYSRRYGENPYGGYDSSGNPFLYRGPADNRLPATERIAAVSLGGEAVAYPFSVLKDQPVVHDVVGGRAIVIFYKTGTASALDTTALAQGRDVGATGVFLPKVDGQALTFIAKDGVFEDEETGSIWNILGQATDGPLEGAALIAVTHGNHLWFSWSVFKPETRIFTGD